MPLSTTLLPANPSALIEAVHRNAKPTLRERADMQRQMQSDGGYLKRPTPVARDGRVAGRRIRLTRENERQRNALAPGAADGFVISAEGSLVGPMRGPESRS